MLQREEVFGCPLDFLLSGGEKSLADLKDRGAHLPGRCGYAVELRSGSSQFGRKRETDVLLDHLDFLEFAVSFLLKSGNDAGDQMLRRGRAGCDPDVGDSVEPLRLNVAPVVDKISLYAIVLADFNEPLGIRAVGRADDEDHLAKFRYAFDGHLAIFGGVADVLRFGSANHRESFFKTRHDVFGFIEAERRLRQICYVRGVWNVQRIHVFDRLHQHHLRGRFAERADDFVMVLVADQDDRVAFARELDGFEMHLRDQRTGRVDDGEAPFLALLANFRGNAVRAEDGAGAGRDFLKLFHKYRAEVAKLVDDVFVVDNFLADVNRRPVEVQSDFDHVDGAHHAGTESAGLEKVDLLVSGCVGADGL